MRTITPQPRLPGICDGEDDNRSVERPIFAPIVSPAETRRLEREIKPRRCGFLDWVTGRGITDRGLRFATPVAEPAMCQLVEILAAWDLERLYLTGPRPHAGEPERFNAWCHDAPEGWDVAGHHLARPDTPVLRFVEPDTGRRVEILRAAIWWGSDQADPLVCREAWLQLAGAIDSRWPGAVLLATPATTGRELIARTIPPDVVWPTLPDDVAEQIRQTAGQGRIELFSSKLEALPELVELDGRTMYGALCKELPGGVPVRGWGEHAYGPYARARMLCRWQVPHNWDHIGLLPVRDGDRWRWPSTPGERASAWVDAVELHLARSRKWDVEVVEHLVWPPTVRSGPLDGWAARLLALIERHRAHRAPAGRLVAAALRHVLIDALGALVGRPHVVTRSTHVDVEAALPAGAVDPRLEGSMLVWGERTPARWAAMVHPEWSAAVWARCRTRMLEGPSVQGVRTGALHVDPAQLLAIRTDALYLTHDPRWPDDGRPGRLVVKRRRPGPLPPPGSVRELLALRDGL